MKKTRVFLKISPSSLLKMVVEIDSRKQTNTVELIDSTYIMILYIDSMHLWKRRIKFNSDGVHKNLVKLFTLWESPPK